MRDVQWPVCNPFPPPEAVMRVLVGGGTGFVGRTLTSLLKSNGHEVTIISRNPGPGRITWQELPSKGLPPCDAAVNLAGENIMNPLRRWTEEFKKEVTNSRVDTTQILARAIARAEKPPEAWVLVTGVSFYAPSETVEYDEDSAGGNYDFASRLVTAMEAAARIPGDSAAAGVTRGVMVRAGRDGGAIPSMLLPFRLGLGGPIGSGCQNLPWIHVADLAGIIAHVLESKNVTGVLNGVAPSFNTNRDFARALGAALRRPTILPLPAFMVNAIFGSERGVMLLEGAKVRPRRTLESGYRYAFPELGPALRDILS
ncbi:epimerase family protein SDR39U1 isoform X2 [Microcaecilia unicolor]|uniref:Epimerase family protein SDR39U1 isoform X2 n=1 Tax=Microcaecilia unicolor TaxID=1415580 RepID=A0A6P7WWA4_9AMPH|nr:epimerase family protein SDR39U1 isoform X2 [Microcaecilia unicolor]